MCNVQGQVWRLLKINLFYYVIHFSKKIMGWEATDINGYYKSINC